MIQVFIGQGMTEKGGGYSEQVYYITSKWKRDKEEFTTTFIEKMERERI